LIRLGWSDRITEIISPEVLLPAMGQGAVGIETRKSDVDNQILLADMDHEETHYALDAERALVSQLDGGCNVPIGSFATLDGDQITLTGLVASLDGKTMYKKELTDIKTNAITLGRRLGDELIELGADRIMQEIKSN
jgi:hydroxymethylbilane synthase